MTEIESFKETVYTYFRSHYREMPWRYCEDPYQIMVSEIMLQQTQVERVIPKFLNFTSLFPTPFVLADASNAEVLSEWQGLGYNRRGLFLKAASEMLVTTYKGVMPRDVDLVDQLPGIGAATAGAIVAYAYNIPTVFIETNIRTVFLHHFFADRNDIDDKELLPLVTEALDRDHPRDWYYALMDYGVMVKKTYGNANTRSAHYAIQSRFEGSDRQLRSKIVRFLLTEGSVSPDEVLALDADPEKVNRVIASLLKDGTLAGSGEKLLIKE
jgi:A/G-specific adenine glycosylase